MTTPKKRLRAMRGEPETLQDIATDGSVPAELIERARRFTIAYPAPEAIDVQVLKGNKPFPQDWTALEAGLSRVSAGHGAEA